MWRRGWQQLVLVVMFVVNAAAEQMTDLRQRNMELLKQSLLQQLNMETVPEVDPSKVKVPSYIMNLYKQIIETGSLEEGTILPSTIRSFTHSELADLKTNQKENIIYFNVSSVSPDEDIHMAELRLSYGVHPGAPKIVVSNHSTTHLGNQRFSSEDALHLMRLRVFDIMQVLPDSGEVLRLLDTDLIDARNNGTVSFDVASALSRWLRQPKGNHGLAVIVEPMMGRKSPYFGKAQLNRHWGTQGGNEDLPLLIVHSFDGREMWAPKRRTKRAKLYTMPYCQRYRMYVDFRAVGWNNWILAPQGYDAYFCKGQCPFNLADHMNATNHAVIQNLVHSRYPSRVPTACCVPTELSPMSMLYLDINNGIVLKNYQDMVVDACGCR